MRRQMGERTQPIGEGQVKGQHKHVSRDTGRRGEYPGPSQQGKRPGRMSMCQTSDVMDAYLADCGPCGIFSRGPFFQCPDNMVSVLL
jgi:hypothetical protein